MPLFITKWERRDGADRDALGRAALNACRYARSCDGVHDARFYWTTPDTVATIVTADPGAWGPGAGLAPNPNGAKAQFGLSDVARMVLNESWVEAGQGERAFMLSKQ